MAWYLFKQGTSLPLFVGIVRCHDESK